MVEPLILQLSLQLFALLWFGILLLLGMAIEKALELGEFDVDIHAGTTWYKYLTIGLGVWDTQWLAQVFSPSETAQYDKVYLHVALHGDTSIPLPSPVTIGIYNVDGSDKPDFSSPIATITEDGTTLPKNTYPILPECPIGKIYEFTSTFTLTAGVKYAIIQSSLQDGAGEQHVLFLRWTNAGSYTYPAYDSNDGGASWNVSENQSTWFGVLKANSMCKIHELNVERTAQSSVIVKSNAFTTISTDSIDQSNDITDSQAGLSIGWWWGQTFTAGKTGALSRIALWLWKTSAIEPNAPFYCSIFNVSGDGKPTGSALTTEAINHSALPTSDPGARNYTVLFSTPITLVTGTKYACVLWTLNTAGVAIYIKYNTVSVYSGGSVVRSRDQGAKWYVLAPDFSFATYSGVYGSTGIQNQNFSLNRATQIENITLEEDQVLEFTLERHQ